MPYRRANFLRPVKTEKHETTWSNLAENASTVKAVVLITTSATEPTTGNQVETGSHVKSIFFESNLNGVDNSSGAQVFHWQIYKNPNGIFTNQDPAVYDASFKKHIIKRGMEMLPDIPLGSGGTVQTKRIFVLKIPKIYQRFGELDQLVLTYKSTSASGINFCGIAIFKEFK